jgi:hypothetical protein
MHTVGAGKRESVLDDYLTRKQLARQIRRDERTLARWEMLRQGPPVTKVGRLVLYRRESVAEWLRNQERRRGRR